MIAGDVHNFTGTAGRDDNDVSVTVEDFHRFKAIAGGNNNVS